MSIDSQQVIDHLQKQLRSLLQLHDVLDEQAAAVEVGDAQRVLDSVGLLRLHLAERVALESERERLLPIWARQLGREGQEISAGLLAEHDPRRGGEIRALSQQIHQEALRVQTLHEHVQARMNAELSFVSCLVQALYPTASSGAYSVSGAPAISAPRTLELHG